MAGTAPPVAAEPGTRARFVAGDPIRGAAAMVVFSYHVALAALFVSGLDFHPDTFDIAFGSVFGEVLSNAELTVYAFFVLSGYLIGRPFVQALLGDRRMPRFSPYFRRRVLRIIPAFWLIVTLVLIRFGTLGSGPGDVLAVYTLVHTYDFTQGPLQTGILGQVWTVHVEMAFYLLLPLAALLLALLLPRLGSLRARMAMLFGAITAVALVSLWARHQLPASYPHLRYFFPLLFAFVPGIALAALETVVPSVARERRWPRNVALALAAAGLLLCMAFAMLKERSPAVPGALAALGTGSIIAAALLHQWSGGRCTRLLDNRPLHWLGERSYSFYLVHVPVLWELQLHAKWLDDPKLAFVVLFAVAFSVSAVLGHLGFRYVEKPFLELDRWPWQRRAPKQGQVAVATPAKAGETAPS